MIMLFEQSAIRQLIGRSSISSKYSLVPIKRGIHTFRKKRNGNNNTNLFGNDISLSFCLGVIAISLAATTSTTKKKIGYNDSILFIQSETVSTYDEEKEQQQEQQPKVSSSSSLWSKNNNNNQIMTKRRTMTKYNPDSNLDINIRFPNNNKNDNDHYSNVMATSMSNIISKEEEGSKSIQQQNGYNNKSKLLFLGTGSSTGCPKPLCSLLFPLQQQQQLHPKSSQTNDEDDALKGEDDLRQLRLEMIGKCKVSNMAIHNGTPESNKNYRGNPSLVISHYCDATKVQKNVIIDVGKTFREHALRWMPRHNITSLDAVVLTHEHMDAMGGLDDLRGFQRILSARHKGTPAQRQTIPIYSSSNCLQTVQRTFPYLVPKKKAVTVQPGKTVVHRDVSALTYNVVTHFQSFQPIPGTNIQMIPLPVMHGEDLICNGYMIIIPSSSSSSISDNNNNNTKTKEKSATTTTILYLSDISRMLPETLEYIQTNFSNNTIDFMIVDSLKHHGTHITHFSLEQAKALSNIIQPTQKTYIVGIDCDDFDDHDIFNETKLPKHIQLAHDGLAIPLH